MNLIAAVDSNWAIGNKGQLLVRIPNDHKMFREETLDKVVVYGRKTLETFPHAKPLDRRTNIILSGNRELRVPGAQVVHSIEELLEACAAYPSNEIYIIGGASVYEQMLPFCDTAHITKVDYAYEADAFFPNLDEDPQWKLDEVLQTGEEYGVRYEMCVYERV